MSPSAWLKLATGLTSMCPSKGWLFPVFKLTVILVMMMSR